MILIKVKSYFGELERAFTTDKESIKFLQELNNNKLATLYALTGGKGKFTPAKYLKNSKSTNGIGYEKDSISTKPMYYDMAAQVGKDHTLKIDITTI
jgi:hypothetical protein